MTGYMQFYNDLLVSATFSPADTLNERSYLYIVNPVAGAHAWQSRRKPRCVFREREQPRRGPGRKQKQRRILW